MADEKQDPQQEQPVAGRHRPMAAPAAAAPPDDTGLEKQTVAGDAPGTPADPDVDLNAATMDGATTPVSDSNARTGDGDVGPPVDLNAATMDGGAGPSVDLKASGVDLNAATLDGGAPAASPDVDLNAATMDGAPSEDIRASAPPPPVQPSVDLNAATLDGDDRPSVNLPASRDGAGVDLNAATLDGGGMPSTGVPGVDLTSATLIGDDGVDLQAATVDGPTAPPRRAASGDLSAPTIDDDLKNHWAATITEDVTEGMTIKGERPGERAKAKPTTASPNKSTHITVNTRSVVDVTQQRMQDRLNVRDRSVDDATGRPGIATGADYELLDALGEGGMGIVYRARQTSIDRSIAIKMIKAQAAQDQAARAKFLGEAAVTGDLDHPNIVPIHDLGDDGRGALFYSMKHVKGKPWDEIIREKSLSENLDILEDVCNAMAFAHDRGIVHRDLKPENIMLGGYGEVLVMDWGLAAAFTDEGKATRLAPRTGVCGTPAYMSPEMALGDGKLIGPVSDVYLLGAILYEVITGYAPHTGATVIKCLESAATNVIRESDVKGELMDIALKAMRTEVNERYASVAEFQEAIKQYKSHYESISLTNRAKEDLKGAQESREYEDFSRSVFGFHEALNLWKKNRDADEGLSQARLAYARCAMEKGDLDLAESQLVEMTEPFSELRRQVVGLRVEREKRDRNLRVLKYVGIGLACVVVVGGSIMTYFINKSRVEAANQARLAKMAADDARKAEKTAKAEKAAADEQREKAKKSAEVARQAAVEAKRQKDQAEKEKERAEKQKERAEKALARAERETLLKRQADARNAKLTELRWVLSGDLAKETQKEKAALYGWPVKRQVKLSDRVNLDLALIPAGRFTMGSHPKEVNRDANESLHDVEISQPFYMGAYEVTRQQWQAVTGKLPATGFRARDLADKSPAESVSYNEIMKDFLPPLQKCAPEGYVFDLPTEAEWEYAARAGSGTAYYFGDDVKQLGMYAIFAGNGRNMTKGVGTRKPNAWGLYDMLGNVAEWTKDDFEPDYYIKLAGQVLDAVKEEVEALKKKYPGKTEKDFADLLEKPPLAVDPMNKVAGKNVAKVVRGGTYMFLPKHLRTAHRRDVQPGNKYPFVGLRVVLRSKTKVKTE